MQRPPRSHTAFWFLSLLAIGLASSMSPTTSAEERRVAVFEPFLSSRGGPACPALLDAGKWRNNERDGDHDDAVDSYRSGDEPFDAPCGRLEGKLFADASDGRLDEFLPLDAAFVAGGVPNLDDLVRYRQKAAMLLLEFRQSQTPTDPPRRQIEAMFDFLHRRIFYGGYDLAYTDLRRVLDEGRFNCVSATVLFNYFARELGFDCRGLEMPGHAMSRVSLPDGTLDVENTCPRWFQLNGHSEQELAVMSRTVGAKGAIDRSKAREVSPIQLAAMIYYNRGVDLLGEKHFAEAARANAKALRLDPQNTIARGNFLATLNNWSIELGNDGRYAEAVTLLRKGLAMDPAFPAFAQNYVHIHHQWIEHLCEKGDFQEALDVLARAAAEMPDREYLHKAQAEVRERWAKSRFSM